MAEPYPNIREGGEGPPSGAEGLILPEVPRIVSPDSLRSFRREGRRAKLPVPYRSAPQCLLIFRVCSGIYGAVLLPIDPVSFLRFVRCSKAGLRSLLRMLLLLGGGLRGDARSRGGCRS